MMAPPPRICLLPRGLLTQAKGSFSLFFFLVVAILVFCAAPVRALDAGVELAEIHQDRKEKTCRERALYERRPYAQTADRRAFLCIARRSLLSLSVIRPFSRARC